MALQAHLNILQQGNAAIAAWRAANTSASLALENADLRAVNLDSLDLRRADLRGANLSGMMLNGTDLREAILRGANLSRAVLKQVHLDSANMDSADLSNADLRSVVSGKCRLNGANLRNALLGDINLSGVTAQGANFDGADIRGTNLGGASLIGSTFIRSRLDRCDFRKAALNSADLSHASIVGAKFHVAGLHNTYFEGTRGAEHARGLEDANGEDPPERSFRECQRRWPERILDWERLRALGRLPLFGASYTALLALPLLFYGFGLYNDKIILLRRWAADMAQRPGEQQILAKLITERLHPLPLPTDALLMVLATVLLAAASTIYALVCPSRVKEFSRDQWCDQLDHSTFTYWPLAWKHRWARFICGACYAVGGAGALWVIARKIWHVGQFVWRYSYIP
jgi:uncharacterized protein YjbI with pentapeptide repeats